MTWHAWQSASERPPAEALDGIDGVINVSGEPINQRWNDEVKRRIRDSRVRATKNLVDGLAAASPSPPVLINQSAVGVYGDRGDALLDESKSLGDGFLADVVVDWEEAARGAEAAGIRLVITRTGHVLDPAGGLLKQLLLPFRLGVGGPLGSGEQWMPWIHRDDEVAMILWALGSDEVTGTLNSTGPTPVTNREFSKTLGRVLRRPAVIPAPRFAVAALRGGELADEITTSQRAVPRRPLDLGFNFRHTELEPALRDLLR